VRLCVNRSATRPQASWLRVAFVPPSATPHALRGNNDRFWLDAKWTSLARS
jgi:hypothetical protein